jgi:hydrogenase-4 component B
MPWTTGFFALGAAAICGLPPLNGFVSEWIIYLGLFDAANARGPSAWGALPAAILIGATGALALACFVKVCGVVFLGAARSAAAAQAHECGGAMRAAMLVLALACALIGLAPVLVWPALARAIGDWRSGWPNADVSSTLATLGLAHVVLALLVVAAGAGLLWRVRRGAPRRAATWDCGFSAPTPRMQYTAGSFAGIITEWFGWILRPERQANPPLEAFPGPASFDERTPETVLERVVEPLARRFISVALAARALQHGRVQAYILYIVIGIALLAGVALLPGGS